jgi:hypothetical protein
MRSTPDEELRLVNLAEIIRAEKVNLRLSERWIVGHVPRAKFPLSKVSDKSYKFGPEYAHRFIQFEIGGNSYRIWILLNESKFIVRSRLGLVVDQDMAVLCDHEWHASEPGWHCHFTKEDERRVDPGAVRKDKKRWPRTVTSSEFGVNRSNVIDRTLSFFGVQVKGDLV